MAPLVRRSWAPRGQTPVLYQRTRMHEKVSAIVALTVSPVRRHVGLYFSLKPDANVDRYWTVAFLRDLRRHLRRPLIVIWDRLNVHRSHFVQDYIAGTAKLEAVFLPPYAPELNPPEYVFSYLKSNPLANLAASDAPALAQITEQAMTELRGCQGLLRAFVRASPLFWT